MALELLGPGVRSRLRSGVAITGVAQCVVELVENAIDAGATCIAVRMDIGKFTIQVCGFELLLHQHSGILRPILKFS